MGEPLPEDAAADTARVHDELTAGTRRGDDARSLDSTEVDAVRDRIERLLAGGRFPEPERGSPLPVAADLTLRHLTVATPLGPFSIVRIADRRRGNHR